MKAFIETSPVQVSDLIHLNRLQFRIAEWASMHSNGEFFQKFFWEWKEETERYYLQITSHQTTYHSAFGELNTLKSEWQGLMNTADVRSEGMRTADFFEMADKLFATEAKTIKSLLRLYGLNENLRTVLEVHSKEIMLLREAMAFLEQYDAIFEGAKVSVLEINEGKAYQTA
ncbi:hypothetical protein [Runella sp.]|uniref:hypothetical protein n=1 Tax=Runella sp. TaxID=1960881 RepID=UPI003D0C74C1